MRKIGKYLLGMLAMALMATGCTDDKLSPDDGEKKVYGPGDAVYMQVTLKFPSANSINSRGETVGPNDDYSTSSNGVEVGSVDENRIYNLMLILAGKNNEFISYALVGGLSGSNENPSGQPVVTNNNAVTINASFSRQAIQNFYDDATITDKENVYVYALCNYTQDMLNQINAYSVSAPLTNEWVDFTQSVIEYSPESGRPNTGVSVLSTTGGLFMSNGVLALKKFPAEAASWDAYSTDTNPFDLSGKNEAANIDNTGSIRVERGMARFDFADGSPTKDQTYVLGTKVDEDDNTATSETLKVKLVRMCLVNMSNQFYLLRHVAASNPAGLAADLNDISLCVPELPWESGEKNGNWVIDSDAGWKLDWKQYSPEKKLETNYSLLFNFPLGNTNDPSADNQNKTWGITPEARINWYTSSIADVLKGTPDINEPTWDPTIQNPNSWNPDNYDYKVWRYVTENTIPSIDAQKNGISTGIVFKGQILPTNDCPKDLAAALAGDYRVDENGNWVGAGVEGGRVVYPNLYVFDRVMYVSWANVRQEALDQKAGSPLYNAVYGNSQQDADGSIIEGKYDPNCADALYTAWQTANGGKFEGAEYDAFRKSIVGSKFAIYQWSSEDGGDTTDKDDSIYPDGGYFCYYFYWNRHNDNHLNGTMGPMEFQVVRNNVYKLAVTEIKDLGHPRRSDNDPDPEDPNKDDEESKLYFRVKVEVLPWTVRVNDIVF